MKNLKYSLVLFAFSVATLYSQTPEDNYLSKVQTLDSTIETLYAVISGEKGEERNWELFRYLFKPDAKLIPSNKSKDSIIDVNYMTPSDYIEVGGPWLIENGFFEKEIARKAETFGAITHVFSTYESFRSAKDTKPFMRGINSIQLLDDGQRWWVINIYWMSENEENPIPTQYLQQ